VRYSDILEREVGIGCGELDGGWCGCHDCDLLFLHKSRWMKLKTEVRELGTEGNL
jgi:hypothetical protein